VVKPGEVGSNIETRILFSRDEQSSFSETDLVIFARDYLGESASNLFCRTG